MDQVFFFISDLIKISIEKDFDAEETLSLIYSCGLQNDLKFFLDLVDYFKYTNRSLSYFKENLSASKLDKAELDIAIKLLFNQQGSSRKRLDRIRHVKKAPSIYKKIKLVFKMIFPSKISLEREFGEKFNILNSLALYLKYWSRVRNDIGKNALKELFLFDEAKVDDSSYTKIIEYFEK